MIHLINMYRLVPSPILQTISILLKSIKIQVLPSRGNYVASVQDLGDALHIVPRCGMSQGCGLHCMGGMRYHAW